MFQTVPLSIIRSSILYTQQWYMSYRFADSWSCSQAVTKPVWHIPLLCVQWKTPDDGQRNCPKHVEFYSKYKFEKLVHIVGFIIRIYHDARSPERQSWSSGKRVPRNPFLVNSITSDAHPHEVLLCNWETIQTNKITKCVCYIFTWLRNSLRMTAVTITS